MSNTASAPLQLQPPETLAAVPPEAAAQAVPLDPAVAAAVDDQLNRFLEGLLNEDVQSDAFRARLDSAFALGREEISVAAQLMQGRFMQRNFKGLEDSPAYKALAEMRQHLDALNPGKDGDLLQPQKILGLIPFGTKLQAYFRKYESAGGQLQKALQQIYAARDDMQRDVIEIEDTRVKLWEAMQKIAAAMRFGEKLDAQLGAKVQALKATDAPRAKALEQEVLFYVRQNLQDMLTQQAVCTNGYLALDILKKTGREMMNGCSRVATTGMSALTVAQTVARATGNQVKLMDTLAGVRTTLEGLISETGRQLGAYVERTAEFASNPMVGMDTIREMFDQTTKAIDALEDFRSKSVEVMGQNNAVMQEQLASVQRYVDRVRQQQIREAVRGEIAGPVAL